MNSVNDLLLNSHDDKGSGEHITSKVAKDLKSAINILKSAFVRRKVMLVEIILSLFNRQLRKIYNKTLKASENMKRIKVMSL